MIPVIRPTIRRNEMGAVLTRLAEDSIAAGELTTELAQAIANYLGRKRAIAVRSWYRGMTLAVRSLELGARARVGISALAPAGACDAIEEAGCEPVVLDVDSRLPVLASPLDVDYRRFALDALIVDARYGYVPDLASFAELGVPIIEDISQGLGGNTGATKLGQIGDLALVGLEAQHIITAGGGAVLCAATSKRQTVLKQALEPAGSVPLLTDMNAALGLAQFRQLESFVQARGEVARRFATALSRSPHRTPTQTGDGEQVFGVFLAVVETSPRDVIAYARSNGVDCARAFAGSVVERLEGTDDGSTSVPAALSFAARTVCFPLYPALQTSERALIERVLGTLP